MAQSLNMVRETYSFCPRCAARVEIGRVPVGAELTCHACGNQFSLNRDRPRRAGAGQGRGEEAKSGPADAKPAERERWTPGAVQLAPPLRLFFPRVFGFPFRLDNLPTTLALGAAAAVLIGAVRLGVWCWIADGEEGDPFSRLLLWNGVLLSSIVGTFSALLTLYLASALGMRVVHETSHGADAVEHWPRLLLLEDFGAAAYLIVAVLLAAVPGVLPGGLMRWLGVSRSWAAAAGIAALLPLILLSTLETRSPLGAFSPRVWHSLLYGWRVWTLFYFVSFAVLAPAAAALAALLRHGGWTLGTAASGLLAAAVWLIYCRLLGRLAWFCSGRWNPLK